MHQLIDLLFQSAKVANALLAFASLFRAKGLGGALALDEAGPAIVGTMEFRRLGFAGAIGFAAGALGGGEAAGQQRELGLKSDLFCFHSPNVYIH